MDATYAGALTDRGMEAVAFPMAAAPPAPKHRELLTLFRRRDQFYAMEIDRSPWVGRSATLRILLVASGRLDFSRRDSDLRLLVDTLASMPGVHVRFEVSVAHRENVPGGMVLEGEHGVARSVTGFRFDDRAHFVASSFDEVWIFGNAPLDPSELRVLREFVTTRGGLLLKEPRVLCPLLQSGS
jgi:hypothetical protein